MQVNNLTKSKIDRNLLERVAKIVLSGENIRKGKRLSIVLVGSAKMRELNKKYRNKDKPTDVLSFDGEKDLLGEVVVCLKEVRKNAKEFRSDFKKELAFVLVHSLMHLTGCDHEKRTAGAKKMQSKEKYYLSKIFS